MRPEEIKNVVYLMQTITDTLKIHFDRSFQILTNVMDVCPDELWAATEENYSIWKRVLQ